MSMRGKGKFIDSVLVDSEETWSASEGERVSKLVLGIRRSYQKKEEKRAKKRLNKKMHRGNDAYHSRSDDREVAHNFPSGGSYLGRIMGSMPGYRVETVVDSRKHCRAKPRDFGKISRTKPQMSRKLKFVSTKAGPSQPQDDDVKAWHQYYGKRNWRGESTRDDEDEDEEAVAVQSLRRGPSRSHDDDVKAWHQYYGNKNGRGESTRDDEEAVAVQSLHRGPSQPHDDDDVNAWYQYYGKKIGRGESARDDEDEEVVSVQSLRRVAGDDVGGRKVAGCHIAMRKEKNGRAKSRDHEKDIICVHADDVKQWQQYYRKR